MRSGVPIRLMVLGCLGLALGLMAQVGPRPVLVEAEGFTEHGGWVVDPQFMDQMGSPYLLAHGLGAPVKDARTTVVLPGPGTYQVWVRTLDWVARWQAPGAPGRFQVFINEQALPVTFGTEGAAWHWQAGGKVTVPQATVQLALHDLTGFEGRCDAVLFVLATTRLEPPNTNPELAAFRRECLGHPPAPEPGGEFDLVVTGGGMAGTCAAIAAARLGLKVALIQDRPVLGGNNSSEVRVWLQGARNKDPWPRVGDVVAELESARRAHYGPANTAELYEDEKKLSVARAEPNLRLFLEHRVNGAEVKQGRISAVVAQEIASGRRFRMAGRWFADCTGDGEVGFLAGADYDLTPKGRMGPCNLWNVSDAGRNAPFPRCPWALDLSKRPFPGRDATKPDILKLGGWYWESGFDRHPIAEMEYVRDWNFRAMYGAWDAMKNVDQVLPNYQLNWSAYIMGKRESRRLLGDYVLTVEDLKLGREYPDGCVPTGWKIDLHLPDPKYENGFAGDAFISKADFGQYPMPYWVPYRCLYSRNLANLFMAGRDISVTHEALGGVRVMRTGGCMGEIVGMAASICKRRSVDPRAVYKRYLAELQELMRRGVGKQSGAEIPYSNQGETVTRKAAPVEKPDWLKQAVNVAPQAKITVTGSKDAVNSPPSLLNDGRADLNDNAQRWISDTHTPHVVEFTWERPQTLGGLRIVSGYRQGRECVAPIEDFALQYHNGERWLMVEGATGRGNDLVDWSRRFAPITTAKARLVITGTRDNTARIWEVELLEVNQAITEPSASLEFIGIGKDGRHFAGAKSGRAFIPWGFNYDHDATGRLLEEYWEAEWDTVAGDFTEMKELGANVVRVHLQVAKFMTAADQPNAAALHQLARLLRLAEARGLYLDLTGLGCYHKQDVPAWYDALPEAARWNTQARFWEAIAGVGVESPAVFCYDLMNEPILAGGDKKETNWLAGELAGKYFVQRITLDLAGRSQTDVAKAWVEKLSAAIRKHDQRHLVTVGVIPWVYVFPKAKPLFYSKEVSANLDFASVHFYPKQNDAVGALTALAAYDIGKPVVVEEMFPLSCDIEELDRFIEGSRPHATGWITFYWGKTIQEYATNSPSIGDAITRKWLEYFRDKAGAVQKYSR
ncbi:MAG: FAD-dependent oxidoreductase [Verrucomicrobiota bacterium]